MYVLTILDNYNFSGIALFVLGFQPSNNVKDSDSMITIKKENPRVKIEPNEECDGTFVEVKKVAWSTKGNKSNQKIIDELTAANTENQRLYFSLQKQIKHSDELKLELNNVETMVDTQAAQLAQNNINIDHLNSELDKARALASSTELKYK